MSKTLIDSLFFVKYAETMVERHGTNPAHVRVIIEREGARTLHGAEVPVGRFEGIITDDVLGRMPVVGDRVHLAMSLDAPPRVKPDEPTEETGDMLAVKAPKPSHDKDIVVLLRKARNGCHVATAFALSESLDDADTVNMVAASIVKMLLHTVRTAEREERKREG